MDTPETVDGSLSLTRWAGCSFQVLRRPGEFTGSYRLLKKAPVERLVPAR